MKRTVPQLIRSFVIITLGAALYALAFDWCFAPNEIGFGGVTGIAQIINHFFPRLTVGVLVIVLNVPLFLVGWKLFGTYMLVSSLWAMFISSVFIDLFAAVFRFGRMEDILLGCVVGGVLLGLSMGVVFLQGATTGGTEIVARLLKLKLAWLPVGKLLLMADYTVVALVALVFGNLDTALYGAVGIYISTAVMDKVLYGLDTSKVAYIISDKPDEIARVILYDLDRSITYLEGQGGYSGAPKKVIMCAFKDRQIVELKEAVRQADPNAFMIVTDAHEVLGEGFGSYHSEF